MGKLSSVIVFGVITATIAVAYILKKNSTTSTSPNSTSPKYFTDICVDAKGEYAYATDNINGKVYKINIANSTLTNLGNSPNPPFSGPNSIAVDSINNVYIHDGLRSDRKDEVNNNMFRKIDKSGNVIDVGKLSEINSITNIKIDANRNIYVLDYSLQTAVFVINPDTYKATQLHINENIKYTYVFMDIDATGHIYLTNYEPLASEFSIYKIDINTGEKINEITINTKDADYFKCMKVDASGEYLYYAFSFDYSVYKVQFKPNNVASILANISAYEEFINSLSIDENNNVYAATINKIYKIDPSGSYKAIL